LGPRTGPLVDRGLGEALRRRQRSEEGARHRGCAVGHQLLVVVDGRVRRPPHGTRHRYRLHVRHERDGDRAGQQGVDAVEGGELGNREAGRHLVDEGDAVVVEPEHRDLPQRCRRRCHVLAVLAGFVVIELPGAGPAPVPSPAGGDDISPPSP